MIALHYDIFADALCQLVFEISTILFLRIEWGFFDVHGVMNTVGGAKIPFNPYIYTVFSYIFRYFKKCFISKYCVKITRFYVTLRQVVAILGTQRANQTRAVIDNGVIIQDVDQTGTNKQTSLRRGLSTRDQLGSWSYEQTLFSSNLDGENRWCEYIL